MLKGSLTCFLLLLLSWSGLYACGGLGLPTSGGQISYSIDSTNPLTVNVTLTLYFDRSEALPTDSVVVDWGDESSSGIYATTIDTDLYALANMPYSPLFVHVYAGSHTYASLPSGGYYLIGTTGEYHVSDITNLNGGSGESIYYIQTTVGMDSSANYFYSPPVLQPVNLMFSGLNSFSDSVPISAPKNGDSVVFQLVQPLQSSANPIPNYLLPSQTCGAFDISFTINSQTGVISWPNVCVQGIFDIATLISTYRNGNLIGSIMRDQLLYTALNAPSAITDIEKPQNLIVYPNPANAVLNISLPGNTGGQLMLYDVSGGEILSNITDNNIQQTIDISALPQGVYLLTFKSSNGLFTQKVVKQ